MRGRVRCRAHRDAVLGPRGAGAPLDNLNALKHGRYSDPFSPSDVESLARRAIERPADLPLQIGLAVHSLRDRIGDPLSTLLALRRLLSQLTPILAAHLFDSELSAFLDPLPPPARAQARAIVERFTPDGSPEERILFLRKIIKRKNN
jgi:hypothetical protein